MSDYLTLADTNTTVMRNLKIADKTLYDQLQSVGTGGTISVPDMVNLQYNMSAYTITASVGSSINKELSDTMKSTVQKIG
ncbi:MAG: hypothetical protein ACRYGK_05855 [Janthinobacterium lividum]